MAQNISLLGADYSAVPSVLLPKTGGGTASFTDVTDTTAAAADVAAGKYFYTASGVRTLGTGSGGGGGGSLTQDQNGYLVVPTTGGGGSTGLEYEEGTWTPTTDTDTTAISFTDTHTTAPAFALVQDIDNTTSSIASTDSVLVYIIVNFNGCYGSVPYSTGSYIVGMSRYSYKTSSGQSMTGSQIATTNSMNNYITASGITFYTATTRYFRANRTYKWIAVWAPTT